MSYLNAPDFHTMEPPTPPKSPRKPVVTPRSVDYDHPYAAKAPQPKFQYNVDISQPVAYKAVAKQPLLSKRIKQAIHILVLLGLGSAFMFFIAQKVTAPVPVDAETVALLNPIPSDLPELGLSESPEEFLNRVSFSGIRLAAAESRIMIDGYIYKVGDVINESLGLVFVGHDPDGEYLLFNDAEGRTHFMLVPSV
ncbi:MAG: hypothetical protein ACQKBV_12765 [Puniceicoccales bacterium]